MNRMWPRLGVYAKKGLAAVLFITLLIGASAAALSVLAAGITALTPGASPNGAPVSVQQQSVLPPSSYPSVPDNPPPTLSQAEAPPIAPANPAVSATRQSHPDWTEQLNRAIDNMQSPVGQAIDSGGVVLGSQLQNQFGSLLSGILQTLFLERSDAAR